MKLNHSSLKILGKLLGYPSFDKGMCRGFSFVLALAILIKDEQSFYARLHLIEIYQNNFAQLNLEVKRIRNKLKKNGTASINEKEWKLLEIPAFFEEVKVFLYPEDHRALFNNTYVCQSDIEKIYALVHSKVLEKKGISILLDKEWVCDCVGLEKWLLDLGQVLSQAQSPVPILLDCPSHSVCFKYNPEKQCWIFTDINDFERFPDQKIYWRELTTQELTESIFQSFYDDLKGNTVFNATALAINPDNNLKETMKTFDLKYAIQPEQALLCNTEGAGLLYQACAVRHSNVANKLLEFGTEVNQATSLGFTPLHTACQHGELDMVSKLLKSRANVNQTTAGGFTPLLIAAQYGHLNVVTKLLESGANVSQAADRGAGQGALSASDRM